jgi:hypothetical protein
MPVSGTGSAVEAKNGIRASIKSLFPDRDCATLVRPMHEEEVRGWLSNRQQCSRISVWSTSGADVVSCRQH